MKRRSTASRRLLSALGVAACLEAAALEPPDGTVLLQRNVAFDLPATNHYDQLGALAVQDDGRLLLAGTAGNYPEREALALARLLENGDLDVGFGDGGRVVDPFPTLAGSFGAVGVAVERTTGRILVAGTEYPSGAPSEIVVARLLAGGEVDTSFQGAGFRRLSWSATGFDSVAAALALDAEGRILIAGRAGTASGSEFACARLTTDGDLDPDFAGVGSVTLPFADPWAEARAIAVESDGAALLAGVAGVGSGRDAAVARLLPTGAPDPDFGISGQLTFEWNVVPQETDVANAVALGQDGRILVAGATCTNIFQGNCIQYGSALARLLPSGALDPTFGTGGTVYGGPSAEARGIAVQGTGEAIVLGSALDGTNNTWDWIVERRLSNGALDSSFGDAGVTRIDFVAPGGSQNDHPDALVLAPDGRIVAAGNSLAGVMLEQDFALARLANAYVFADGFDSGSAGRWSALLP
jgi:uncharacterized delta-60 repeat protein